LRDLFATDKSWQQVKQALTLDVQLSPEERSQLGLESGKEEDEDEGEDKVDDSTFSTATEEGDIREERYWESKHEPTLKSFYEDAKEQEQIVKDTERPLTLAKRALRNVDAIPADREKLSEQDIDDVLRRIIARTNELRKIIQKPTSKKHALRSQQSKARRGNKQNKRPRKGNT
jgi:DNA-directed RNA polymerase beta' subunit